MYKDYVLIRKGEEFYYKGEYICLDDDHCINNKRIPIPWTKSCCKYSGVRYLEKLEIGTYKFYFKIYDINCNTEKV